MIKYEVVADEKSWDEMFPEIQVKNRKRVVGEETPRTLLLLGAGFTNRYNPNNWSYDKIWDNAQEKGEDKPIGKIMRKYQNCVPESEQSNFEKLLASAKNFNDFVSYIQNDLFKVFVEDGIYAGIKKIFVEAMIQCGLGTTLDNIPTLEIGRLLTRFDQVHTLCYDPILYWSIMKYIGDLPNKPEKVFPIGDYFLSGGIYYTDGVFDQGAMKRDMTLVSYNHGALFLSTDMENKTIKKLSTSKNEKSEFLIEHVNNHYECRLEQPLIVTDATSEQKLEMILSNEYLSDCYHRLNSFNADRICIIGFKGNKNDKHIMDAIIHNRPKEVVFCYWKNLEEEQKAFLEEIKRRDPNCSLSVYDVLDAKDGKLPSDFGFREITDFASNAE